MHFLFFVVSCIKPLKAKDNFSPPPSMSSEIPPRRMIDTDELTRMAREASIVGICLLAPFAEELVMRGGVEEYLLRWKPNAALAIVLSSLLFGVLHFYPSLIVTAFLNGLLYGWVYYRSRNVVACFLMHMVNNTASCLADWLRPDDSTCLDILFQTRVIIITLFCIVFMIASLGNIKKKTMQKA